ncbi:MAG: S-adenosylmethionine:tRNA ribosyltransferase-isomerase, partial [Desulfobacterales bacterium]
MYHLSDYEYELPKELIAQHPVRERDRSRLLCLDRRSEAIFHRRFEEIPALLGPRDLLVVNNTAVVPARLIGKKATGGRVEVLILDYPGLIKTAAAGAAEAECLIKASKAPGPGTRILFDGGVLARVLERTGATFRVGFDGATDFDTV